MNKLLIAALGAALLIGAGCRQDKEDEMDGSTTMRTERTSTMSGDDCAMCEGKQVALANGKCPTCGMTVRPASR
jgi:hypothetical protein